MFQEEIGQHTADHLRTHIEAYLAAVNARFTKPVKLVLPKSIEPASVVGGMMTEFDNILPQYGIDIVQIGRSQDQYGLWTWEYDGQINGLVNSNSRENVDALVNRHESAVARFIEEHQYLHQHSTDYYRIVEFGATGTEFSGAEHVGEVNDREIWLAAFSINVVWLVNQDGPNQHA